MRSVISSKADPRYPVVRLRLRPSITPLDAKDIPMRFLLVAVAVSLVGSVLSTNYRFPRFKEGNLTCYIRRQPIMRSANDEYYKEISMTAFYRACISNNVTTENYTEGKFSRLLLRSATTPLMEEVVQKENFLNNVLDSMKNSTFLEILKAFTFAKDLLAGASPIARKKFSHKYYSIFSCDIADLSMKLKICYDLEKISEIESQVKKISTSTPIATESNRRDTLLEEPEKKP